MRRSRETELLEVFPPHVVAAWMGHDVKMCMKHSAQVTDDHFERAAKSGTESATLAAQKAAHSGDAASGGERNQSPQVDKSLPFTAVPVSVFPFSEKMFSGETGNPTPSNFQAETANSASGGAKRGAVNMYSLVSSLDQLPQEVREAVIALINAANRANNLAANLTE